MSKYIKLGILCLTMFLGACASNSATVASLMVGEVVKLDKEGKLEIAGSGFAPGQEVNLVFKTLDGVESDIGYALEPAPVSDADGNWKTTWSYGRFVKKKLVSEGKFNLIATDQDYAPVANASITFTK